jgi:hypothetical protein
VAIEASVRSTPRNRFALFLLLGATLVIAAVGPALVVFDRWLNARRSDRYLSDFAARFPILRDVSLPDYAVVILAAFLALLALGRPWRFETAGLWTRRLVFARRPRRPTAGPRQREVATVLAGAGALVAGALFFGVVRSRRIPGPELLAALVAFGSGMLLREVSVGALRRVGRRSRAVLLSIAAAHAAVIWALAAHYSFHRFQVPALAVALAAVANLAARWRRTGPLPLIVLAFVCLYTWRINAWWFALVGDEYRNFEIAAGIVQQQDRSYVASHLFQLEGGLEGLDPYACSLVQAAAMRVLGVDSFGWRFSSLYLAAISLPFFHRFLRTFLTRRGALAATVCLGASHYVIAFGKIGYDKFQAYFAIAVLFASAAFAIRTRRTIAFVATGLAAGLCFYVYPAALYVIPLPGFLLLFYAPPRDRETALRWAVTALAAVLTMFPLPFQPTYFEGKRPGTVYYNPELVASASRLVHHFWTNSIYAVFSPLLLAGEDHFVTSSYLDPLTGLFFLIGLASAVWLARRDRFAAFLLLSLGWLLFWAGTTHDRAYPPTTRMFLLLPIFVPLAVLGMDRVLGLARTAGLSARVVSRAVAATLVAIVALNTVQAHVVSVRRSDGYQIFDPLMVRLARRDESLPAARRLRFRVLNGPDGSKADIPMILRVYDLQESARNFAELTVSANGLSAADLARIADPSLAVLASPYMSPEVRDRVERQIAAAGKVSCSVRTTTGQERFKLWTAPGAPDLCAGD